MKTNSSTRFITPEQNYRSVSEPEETPMLKITILSLIGSEGSTVCYHGTDGESLYEIHVAELFPDYPLMFSENEDGLPELFGGHITIKNLTHLDIEYPPVPEDEVYTAGENIRIVFSASYMKYTFMKTEEQMICD